jgi:hypothetical protein
MDSSVESLTSNYSLITNFDIKRYDSAMPNYFASTFCNPNVSFFPPKSRRIFLIFPGPPFFGKRLRRLENNIQ